VVTENARDFDRIVRSWAAAGEHHALRGHVEPAPTWSRRWGTAVVLPPIALAVRVASYLGLGPLHSGPQGPSVVGQCYALHL